MGTLQLNNLTLGYDGHPAVHHLNGTVKKGSLTAIFGPNGAGKSTLLKGLAGLLKPISGSIKFVDMNANDLAYLPQASDIDRSFPASVSDLVATGLYQRRRLFAGFSKEDQKDVTSSLAAVGLEGFATRGLDTLSGGQFQRVLFARVMLQDTQLILLDEPFSAIDAKTTADLLVFVSMWQKQGRTILAVLHDEELVRQHFPETLLLAREPLGWGPTTQVLTAPNLKHARHIHEAWDDAAPDCERDAHGHAH